MFCNALAFASILAVAPVVDIDGTLFVQAGMFLGLMLVLNGVLYRPWLATLDRREEAIGGALTKAKRMRHEADALAVQYDQKLAVARDDAAELRSAARREEEQKQAAELANARSQASTELGAAKARVQREAEAARGALDTKTGELAEEIAAKILGRAS